MVAEQKDVVGFGVIESEEYVAVSLVQTTGQDHDLLETWDCCGCCCCCWSLLLRQEEVMEVDDQAVDQVFH